MPQNIYVIEEAQTASALLASRLKRPCGVLPGAPAALQDFCEKQEMTVISIPPVLTENKKIRGILKNTGVILDGAVPIDQQLTALTDWRQEAPYRTIRFRNFLKKCSKASSEWHLFAPDDRILVGVSGGQDSLVMMHLLTALQRRLPFPVTVIPATIDLGYPGFDLSAVKGYCDHQGWPLHVESLPEIQDFFNRQHVGDKPCPLCSRLRRGKLHGLLTRFNCNKLALGQHLDDLCVSFLMSLFRGGGLKTMSPHTFADGGKAELIRPLWECTKSEISEIAALFDFPVISSCPFEEALQDQGDRAYLERLLGDLEGHFPDIRSAMKHSLGDIRLEHLLVQPQTEPQNKRL